MMPNQSKMPLFCALQTWGTHPHAAFYLPGHKRGQGAPSCLKNAWGSGIFTADLPELPQVGNLFSSDGAIATAQELAAAAFGADRTWFLVNGSTCGIIAALLATCGPGDKVILPRSIHQSVISGLVFSGALPVFLAPEYNPEADVIYSVTPEAVENALAHHPEVRAVLVVYPTYQGICGDLGAIVRITQRYQVPLVVDEAHGSHLSFHPDLPLSALECGADLTVQSAHKTLSALSQAALLHLRGNRVDPTRVAQALQMIQTSSPSALLLASLDAARHQMVEEGTARLSQVLDQRAKVCDRLHQISQVRVFEPTPLPQAGCHGVDRTRLVLNFPGLNLSGFTIDHHLNQKLGVIAELPTFRSLTFVLTIGTTDAEIDHLITGIQTLVRHPPHFSDDSLFFCSDLRDFALRVQAFLSKSALTTPSLSPRDAFFAPTEIMPLAEAVDRISAELICPYPPGIPVLMPGERIDGGAIAYLQRVQQLGQDVAIQGCSDPSLQQIKVVKTK